MWITKYGEKDVRRTIHFLQELVFYFGNVPGRELTVEDVDAVKQITSNTVADYNLLDITRTIFSRKIPLDELHGMYKSDPYLIQIMMHDNLHVQLQQKNVLSTDSVETMDPYTDTLHHLNLSSLLASQKGHWELTYAIAGMCCGVANDRIGSLPNKYNTSKKVQFTNTLTKSATQTNTMHTLTDVSRHLRLHLTHFPRMIPIMLNHICNQPEAVVSYGLSFGEIEKLLQVYSKWNTASSVGTTGGTTDGTTGGTKSTNTNTNDIHKRNTSSTKPKKEKTSNNDVPVTHVTSRLKKKWKMFLQNSINES